MREKEKVTTVIFWRHGITDYSEDRIYKEEDDPSLNEKGRVQASMLSEMFKSFPFDKIYISPSARTRQTAEPIFTQLRLDPIFVPEIKERNFGEWEGLTFKEIEEKFRDKFKQWKSDQIGFKPLGGESIKELSERVNNCIKKIIKENTHKKILIVSHVGPIRVAVANAMEMPIQNYRMLNITYGSASRIDYGSKQNNLMLLGLVPFSKMES